MLKRVFGVVWDIIEVVVIVYVIFMTSCILCRNKYGYTQFDKYVFVTVSENNNKFLPDYKPGDLLIIKSQSSGINVGDVVYYYVTVNEEYIVKSGIVETKMEDDYSALYTLKDGGNVSIAGNRVIGKYVSIESGKGAILDFLEGRVGFLLCVLLPVLLIFIYQIYRLFVTAKYDEVDDEVDIEEKSANSKMLDEPTKISIEKVSIEVEKKSTDDVELL